MDTMCFIWRRGSSGLIAWLFQIRRWLFRFSLHQKECHYCHNNNDGDHNSSYNTTSYSRFFVLIFCATASILASGSSPTWFMVLFAFRYWRRPRRRGWCRSWAPRITTRPVITFVPFLWLEKFMAKIRFLVTKLLIMAMLTEGLCFSTAPVSNLWNYCFLHSCE